MVGLPDDGGTVEVIWAEPVSQKKKIQNKSISLSQGPGKTFCSTGARPVPHDDVELPQPGAAAGPPRAFDIIYNNEKKKLKGWENISVHECVHVSARGAARSDRI
jgi:hypothetical protein